ncbi:hypothetical protein GCM10022202_01380 [Microbacterium marinilacus]|uniref:Uncharacterized protein n=1 Tax=Microbacterium marinilacus TaxID=415209 RepID=A0ABP7B255_9MICO
MCGHARLLLVEDAHGRLSLRYRLPGPDEIARRSDRIRIDVMARVGRSRHRIRIVAAIVAALAFTGAGVAGAGVATAFHPTIVDMQGVMRTEFVDELVACNEEAGVETVILTGVTAAEVLAGWPDASPSTHSAIELRMDSRNQGELGRAVSACQAEIAERAGEPAL